MIAAFLCAALSYPGKAHERLPWTGPHIPSQPGNWFHHAVNEWTENIRGPVDEDGINRSPNTRLWSCFLAFTNLVQFVAICALTVAVCVQLIVH